MSYIQFRQKCLDCDWKWNAAFGIVGTTQIASAPTECPACGSKFITNIGVGWELENGKFSTIPEPGPIFSSITTPGPGAVVVLDNALDNTLTGGKVPYEAKQVILMRKDLRNTKGQKIHTGKLCAQAAHASLAAYKTADRNDPAFIAWDTGSFAKIVLAVNSEEDLLSLVPALMQKHLNISVIRDVGNTEFGGVTTLTCIGIGPHWSYEIDEITQHLSLF